MEVKVAPLKEDDELDAEEERGSFSGAEEATLRLTITEGTDRQIHSVRIENLDQKLLDQKPLDQKPLDQKPAPLVSKASSPSRSAAEEGAPSPASPGPDPPYILFTAEQTSRDALPKNNNGDVSPDAVSPPPGRR